MSQTKLIILVLILAILISSCELPPENSCKWCFLEKSDYVRCYCDENGTMIRDYTESYKDFMRDEWNQSEQS